MTDKSIVCNHRYKVGINNRKADSFLTASDPKIITLHAVEGFSLKDCHFIILVGGAFAENAKRAAGKAMKRSL